MLTRGTVKTFNLGLNFIPTVVQVFYPKATDLVYQIINTELYKYIKLQLPDIPQLPNGDFWIQLEFDYSQFLSVVNTFYNPE